MKAGQRMCQGESMSWRLTSWSVGFSTQEWDETRGKWAKENRRLPHEDTDKTRQLLLHLQRRRLYSYGCQGKARGGVVWGLTTSWERKTLRLSLERLKTDTRKAALSGRITDDDRDCAEW